MKQRLQQHVVGVCMSVVALALLSLVALATLFPAMRQNLLHKLGLSEKDSNSLAVNSCLIDQKDDSEEVYFLSCGGIY